MQKVEVPTSHDLCDRSRRRRRRRRRLTRAQILEHHLEHGAQLVARLGIERGEVGVEERIGQVAWRARAERVQAAATWGIRRLARRLHLHVCV